MYEFDRYNKSGTATISSFPGASSQQMFHYLNIHLKSTQIKAAVIHIGTNNIPRDSSQSNVDELLLNIKYLFEK